MNYEKHLQDLIFSNKEYNLTNEDEKTIRYEGIDKYILKKLLSSKFRTSKVADILQKRIEDIIDYSIENFLPIHISVPFGGFKKWQLPSYPEVDWAELFNIVLLINWLLPIASGYNKGVILDYYSDEIFISRMNNIPQVDLDIYNNQFETILKLFSKTLPGNFKLKFSKIRDQISQEELLKRFDLAIIKLRDEWEDLPESVQKERLQKSERNYKKDFNDFPKEEKYSELLESTLIHDAFIFDPNWEKDVPWAFDKDMIPVGFRYTKTWGLPIKSSQSSAVQFWVGFGVLLEKDNDLISSILTYSQLKQEEQNLNFKTINLFDPSFKNLQTIPVLKID